MLNRRFAIPVVVLGMIVSVSYAQRKPVAKPATPSKKVAADVAVALASGTTSGTIAKSDFLREIGKPLRSAGRIEGFTFMYGERAFYEDSASNPMLVTDYLTQYCYGDTLPAVIRNTLMERCKPGDTAYYEGIRIRKDDGTEQRGTSLKFTITP